MWWWGVAWEPFRAVGPALCTPTRERYQLLVNDRMVYALAASVALEYVCVCSNSS